MLDFSSDMDVYSSISREEYAEYLSSDRLAFTEEVFNQIGKGKYVSNWHVECIVEHLQALDDNELYVDGVQVNNLIVNMPPRLMKTISISIADSCWIHGHDPTAQIICASHSLKIGKEINRKCLQVIHSDVYKAAFPGVHLVKDTEEWFKTTENGHRLVATVGNKILGFGADRLYIDDPIDPQGAKSETERETANDWVSTSLFPRANDQNTIKKILVMQRLHMDDPTGYLLESGGWYHLCLPGEFKKRTVVEIRGKKWVRNEGDFLFPERMDRDVLEKMKRDLTSFGYAGQILQEPVPPGGGEFKAEWLQFYNNKSAKFTAEGMNVFILVDPASGKEKQKKERTALRRQKEPDQDYTAMMVVGAHRDHNYYILDMVRDRLNPTQRIDTLLKLHRKWNSLSGKPPRVAYEDYGMQSDMYYLRKAMEDIGYHFHVVAVGGRVDKNSRIRKLVPDFENRRFFLPRTIWYETVEGNRVELVEQFIKDEYEGFPNVMKHDDMLDALARIYEEDLYVTFPTIELVLHRADGGAYADHSEYDEDDFTTW